MPNSYGETQAELLEQLRRLKQRVDDGLYTHEIEEFRIALAAYERAWELLEVAEDLGSRTTCESRNVVRLVRLRSGTRGVLKIAGNVREPGEAEVLAAWHRAGLPCVEPLAWGYLSAEGGTASYLLTRFVDAKPLGRPEPAATLEQRSGLARRLTEFMRPFHDSAATVPRARTWEDGLRLHLRWTLPLVREHGLAEPAGWEEKLTTLSRQGQIVVHGDPAGTNILVRADGGLVLLDPSGALRAMREADVGRICSQVGEAEHAIAVVDAVCEADPRLDPSAVAAFSGLNFLTWAGYFLVDHESPDVETGVADSEGRVRRARRYLEIASAFLDRFPLDSA